MFKEAKAPARAGLLTARRRPVAGLIAAMALMVPAVGIGEPSEETPWWVGDGGVGPFYSWKAPFPRMHGQLLRQESLPLDKAPKTAAAARRILYSSVNGFGPAKAVAVSGAIYLPAGTAPPGGWPVVAWAHGTLGLADICAPSFTGLRPRDDTYLSRWLQHGYAVVATDYQGLGTPGPHAYMVADSAARSVLDGVRAARQAVPGLGKRTVITGQSQGAHAVIATALIQRDYAPDVPIAGAVATGTPSEAGFPPPGTIEAGIAPVRKAPRGITRGLPTETFDAWAIVYLNYASSYGAKDPTYRPSNLFTPKGEALLRAVATKCSSPPEAAAFFTEAPVLTKIFRTNPTPYEERFARDRGYRSLKLAVPLFMGVGLQDEQTDPELQFNVAKAACAAGTKLTIRFYPGNTHAAALLTSQSDAIAWADALLAGKLPRSDCASLAWPGRS